MLEEDKKISYIFHPPKKCEIKDWGVTQELGEGWIYELYELSYDQFMDM